jgi:hypothetical protein
MCSADQLLAQIEQLRKKMIQVALENGFTNKDSIAISQELDKLLTRYQNKVKNK